MLHKLGYEYTCARCEKPKREEAMAAFHSNICITCEEALGPEEINDAMQVWERTGYQKEY